VKSRVCGQFMARTNTLLLHQQRGVALITAILIVSIVATITAFLSLDQQVWLRQVQNITDKAQSDVITDSVLNWITILLTEDAKLTETDHLQEEWAQQFPPIPVEEGAVAGKIEDAQSRFNLNNLVKKDGSVSTGDAAMFRRLLAAQALDENLVDRVIDWIDNNTQRSPYGAEDSEYLGLQPAYRVANRSFASKQELRLVMGFNRQTIDKISEFVTVLPGRTSININTASAEVLSAMFATLSLSDAQQIISKRKDKPFENKNDLMQQQVVQGQAAPTVAYDVKTEYFDIHLDTQYGRLYRRKQALIHRPGNGNSTVVWRNQKALVISIGNDEEEDA